MEKSNQSHTGTQTNRIQSPKAVTLNSETKKVSSGKQNPEERIHYEQPSPWAADMLSLPANLAHQHAESVYMAADMFNLPCTPKAFSDSVRKA